MTHRQAQVPAESLTDLSDLEQAILCCSVHLLHQMVADGVQVEISMPDEATRKIKAGEVQALMIKLGAPDSTLETGTVPSDIH